MLVKIVEQQLMSRSFTEFLNTLESNISKQKEIVKKILNIFEDSHQGEHPPFELKDLQDIARNIQKSLTFSDENRSSNVCCPGTDLTQDDAECLHDVIAEDDSNMFMGEPMNEDEYEILEDGLSESEDAPRQEKLTIQDIFTMIKNKALRSVKAYLPPCA